jgi:predicted nucleic acid-binding protein
VGPLRTIRGFLKGIETPVERETRQSMNLVDSSGWLEYFADGPNAKVLARPLQDPEDLIVPTVCLYEAFKIVSRQRGTAAAPQTVALMRQGTIVELSERIALLAAELSLEHKLPMADSVILATARVHTAHIWTQDADHTGIEGVTVVGNTS